MRMTTVDEFRDKLASMREVVALCGAGISMPAPTSLPSGNELRDICVSRLLKDKLNSALVERLLRSPTYQALLPEAVLQEVGYFAQSQIDRLLARVLSERPPNAMHASIADRFPEIFTTNFENCLELSGARKVHHLHGSIDRKRGFCTACRLLDAQLAV